MLDTSSSNANFYDDENLIFNYLQSEILLTVDNRNWHIFTDRDPQ